VRNVPNIVLDNSKQAFAGSQVDLVIALNGYYERKLISRIRRAGASDA
jgi:hypothetical protein